MNNKSTRPMKTRQTLTLVSVAVTLVLLATFGIFRQTQQVQARAEMNRPMPVDPTPTPCPGAGPECYSVLPSDTDGVVSPDDCEDRPYVAIGCDAEPPEGWGIDANNNTEHFLYVPPQRTNTGKL